MQGRQEVRQESHKLPMHGFNSHPCVHLRGGNWVSVGYLCGHGQRTERGSREDDFIV